ncbi:sulfotransferase [Palleronia sp. LCG004]|uniref:sulfotransferase n=1 Tax=Palleronia sp. LCG004 TaxID=3079304 RepID=UPI002941F29F|nr:sulfotransferase [Palleronia sp. LCG004]WOI58365.1 sulfotransferase [Palleronia sp. LCG004]
MPLFRTAPKAHGRRFVIMGLPRSGTTYLMTLLNAHRQVYCSGEQFNPYAVVDIADRDNTVETIGTRDGDPAGHVERFFDKALAGRHDRVGFKFMLGHNVDALESILEDRDLTLLYVHRDNKLAQVSSWIKAAKTRNWAQNRVDEHVSRKIDAGPRKISQHWHDYATMDRLFAHLFDTLPHHKMQVEYRTMFAPGFNDRLCDFMGIKRDGGMKSPLVKQGSNDILERFEDPEPIRKYFTRIGRADWLEPEL